MTAPKLRFPELADADALLDAVHESLAEIGPWMSWCHSGYSSDDARQWIAGGGAGRETGQAYEFLILDADDRLLGVCGVNAVNAGHRFANLGYWVRTSATGRGVAVDAVRLAARWAFENTGLARLEIVVAVGNARSQRVAEKAGAFREGTLRARLCIHGVSHDAVMYSLVR